MRRGTVRHSARERRRGALGLAGVVTAAILGLTACSGQEPQTSSLSSWSQIQSAAKGETVNLWMYGGDQQGNSYVDNHLIPAAAKEGVTLKRVPVTDTKDALNRILSEKQAGLTHGSIDLVWVNGSNFGTGKQADAWKCNWTRVLPNMKYTDAGDPLLKDDFGTPVDGCEAPWHKAQFALAYNAATVTNPPHSFAELATWITANPGRFSYPAPPDFTGSVFVREMLYNTSGGYANVPLQFSQKVYDALTPELYKRLNALKASLWKSGSTYPKDSEALNQLYADRQVDFTMTYGPATLTDLVANGTYPPETRIATMDEGTVGNASFLAIPSTSGASAGAMVVANLALSPAQQALTADPKVWGQFTVLDLSKLSTSDRAAFQNLPASPVVPRYDILSKNANPELSAAWVPAIDDGWRTNVQSSQ
ncbi:MAG: ABC transporter substrate-binding protein [Microbacteriaceae bacterium]